MDLFQLQNGSDIRGIAIEGVSGEKVNFTPVDSAAITQAFLSWLSSKTKKELSTLKLAIGRDPRLSGEALSAAAMDLIVKSGANVYDCGLSSTPAMFMATIFEEMGVDGAIMFTASHLPYNRNGMKFFTKDGGLDKSDITEILKIADHKKLSDGNFVLTVPGIKSRYHLLDRYSDHLVELIRAGVGVHSGMDTPLKGLKIIVDAGNGSGGFFKAILESLGADTSGSQFLDPDGRFPNHMPNPEDQEAMDSIVQAVLNNHADLGIIFDTDVDRAAVVDSKGNAVNRNRLIALLSAIVAKNEKNAMIVTDSVTSDGLQVFLNEIGCQHHRYKRGYKNVINEAIRLNKEGINAPLAIETSGHGAFRENYFLDDGAYIVTKILIELSKQNAVGKNVFDLIDSLSEPEVASEFRMKINCDDFKTLGENVLEALRVHLEGHASYQICMPNFEGVRVNYKAGEHEGWFLVRMSLHDPVLPINIEANSEAAHDRMKTDLLDFFNHFPELS